MLQTARPLGSAQYDFTSHIIIKIMILYNLLEPVSLVWVESHMILNRMVAYSIVL
jgi:hypothetical protein